MGEVVEPCGELYAPRLPFEHCVFPRLDPEPPLRCAAGENLLPRHESRDLIPLDVDALDGSRMPRASMRSAASWSSSRRGPERQRNTAGTPAQRIPAHTSHGALPLVTARTRKRRPKIGGTTTKAKAFQRLT
jgi:hypothetical protein